MFVVGNEELDAQPKLGTTTTCYRCGGTHPVIDSEPPGTLQAVRCGEVTLLVGIKWRRLRDPEDK